MSQANASKIRATVCKGKIIEEIQEILQGIDSADSLRRVYNLAKRLKGKEPGQCPSSLRSSST